MFTVMRRKPINKCIFLDMGHGKISPTGKYTTAPSKEYYHKHEVFHNGGWFYEGVKNADYGLILMEKLIRKGIHVVPVCHTWQDTPLQARTNLANNYHNTIQQGIFISEHSNAIVGPGRPENKTATGLSVWTSIGQTFSDVLATEFINMYKNEFKCDIEHQKLKVNTQEYGDNDPDYEAKFHVLVMTQMPAVLFENLFFDHLSDARKLFEYHYVNRYTDIQAEWAEWCVRQ